MKPSRILIADDEHATCRYIDKQLKMESSIDATVEFAYDRDEAMALLTRNPDYDLILVDLWMPNADGILDREAGLKILKHSKARQLAPQAIVITANISSKTALEASGLGIYDYISKPIDYTHLITIIKGALNQRTRDAINQESPSATEAEEIEGNEIIGSSSATIEVMKKVGRVALSDVDVLIYGESGTGKESVAHAIHAHSPRPEGPFIVVNCSAIPAELIEAELFGIGKRVATAVDQRPGKFQQADGGTIFLDEIGDLALAMQPKLLRVLDSKELQGIGMDVQRVNVRVIAATNRDLRAAVDAGTFRSDLYYRLKFMITLPPLREREGDIRLLASHFLRKHARTSDSGQIHGFDEAVLPAFEQYQWPGNVRELEKAIQYAIVTCTGNLIAQNDLPPEIFSAPDVETLHRDQERDTTPLRSLLNLPTIKEASQGFETIFLEYKLKQNNWNIQVTAQQIGIKRQSLHRKIKELGLERNAN